MSSDLKGEIVLPQDSALGSWIQAILTYGYSTDSFSKKHQIHTKMVRNIVSEGHVWRS